MRKFRSIKFSLLALLVFVCSLAVLPGTSFAATRSDLSSPPRASGPGPQVVSCGSYVGWVFDTGVSKGETLAQFGGTYTNYNGTGSTVSMTLSSTIGGTLSISTTASVEVDASAVLAGAKATVSATLSASITASSTNSITFNVPSHQYGHGDYGVWFYNIYGHYYYYNAPQCKITEDDGYITFKVPSGVGWNIWTSTN